MIDLTPYKKHELLAVIDLSEYFVKGKSWLFDTVKSLHKPVYQDNERIVFFLDQSDVYEYEDAEGEIETALDQYLSEIDIPEYFVIKKFNHTKVTQVFDDTRCVLPWIHLYFDPTGKILPCCIALGDFGNISNFETVDQALNSEAFKKLRLTMLENKRSQACKNCYVKENNNLLSDRLFFKKFHEKHKDIFDTTNADGSISNFKIRDAVIGLDNICNFKCRTCYSDLSFKIEQEDIALGILKNPLVKNKDNKNFQSFLTDVKEQLPNIEYFHFFGGEPLLTNEHYDILDLLIEKDYTSLNLSYHTNLSVLGYKQKNIIDYWKHFSNLVVKASLDGYGRKAEYIRHGTNWATILKNIQTLQSSLPNVKLKVNSTFSVYNAFHLTDLHRELLTKQLFSCEAFEINVALGDLNDVRMLPASLKKEVEDNILNFIRYVHPLENSNSLIEYYQQMIRFMQSEDKTYLIPKFLEQVALRDQYRNQNLFDIFPELQSMIDFIN